MISAHNKWRENAYFKSLERVNDLGEGGCNFIDFKIYNKIMFLKHNFKKNLQIKHDFLSKCDLWIRISKTWFQLTMIESFMFWGV